MSAAPGKGSSALASWMKGAPSEAVVMVPTTPVEQVDPAESAESLDEPVVPIIKSKKKKSVVKKVTIVVPEPEPEPVPESVYDEETDDECEVDEVEIDGETYYKDSDGKLFDPETSEEVGMLVDGKIVKE
jgi:hypothetical protein